MLLGGYNEQDVNTDVWTFDPEARVWRWHFELSLPIPPKDNVCQFYFEQQGGGLRGRLSGDVAGRAGECQCGWFYH